MPSSEQKNGLIVMLRAYVLGFAAAASLTNNYAVVEAALPFDCDEGFHEERSSSDGTHLCRSDDNTGHWHCPGGYVRVTRAPYCRLLLRGNGGGHRHGQQGTTVSMAEASLGESATVAATGGAAGAGASQSTPFETARAARARLVLAGSSGAIEEAGIVTAAGAVEGLASEPCTMHTYFGTKAERPEDHAGNVATLASWRRGWEGRGWRTRVITEKEAAAHPQYAALRATFRRLPTVNSAEYELACFIRHLAMAAVGGGWMSDYDVVPLALPACAPLSFNGGFTTHQGFVPSLVSGTSAEYLRVTRLMAAVPYQAHNALFKHRSSGLPHVSDMRALQYLSASQQIHVWPPRSFNPSCGVAEANLVFSLANGPNCPTSRSSGGGPTPIGAPTVDCPDHDARVSGSVYRNRVAMRAAARSNAASSASSASASGSSSASSSSAGNTNLVGPLGAHLSHTSMTAFSSSSSSGQSAASSQAAALSNVARAQGRTYGDWLPAPLLKAVQESGPGARQRTNFHQTRGALLELMPSAYANACSSAAKPRRLTTTAAAVDSSSGINNTRRSIDSSSEPEDFAFFNEVEGELSEGTPRTTPALSSSSSSSSRHHRRRRHMLQYHDKSHWKSGEGNGNADQAHRRLNEEEEEDEEGDELLLQARQFHRRRRRRRGGGGGSMSSMSTGEGDSSSGDGGSSVVGGRSRGRSSSSRSSGLVKSGRLNRKQANETKLAAMLREKPTSAFAQAAAQRWASKGEGRTSVASVQAKNDATAAKTKLSRSSSGFPAGVSTGSSE